MRVAPSDGVSGHPSLSNFLETAGDMPIDPPGLPLTVLDAVNVLLRAVSLREVASVNANVDASNAYQALNRANTVIQSKGWLCNTIEKVVLTRNPGPTPALNTVTVPATYLSIRPYRGGNVWDKYLTTRVSGGVKLLYNLTDRTNVFTANPELDIIEALDFADLPVSLRWYIACHAGRFFMPETYPTPTFYRFSDVVEQQAKAWAEQEDEMLRDSILPETSPHFGKMRRR